MPNLSSSSAGPWMLDPGLIYLNHGSFGSCPRPVLAQQQAWRERMERQPMQFLVRDLESLLDEARHGLGKILGAKPQDLVFVPNATTAVNAVLGSMVLEPDDEILITNHAYNACRNAAAEAARIAGARLVEAQVDFPIQSPDQVLEAILARITPRTRLALVDHVTSPTALVLPIGRIVQALESRGVAVLVDAAHAPGMVEMNLQDQGASFTAGNCHKWLCAPKGAGFLHVRRDRQQALRPLSISHAASSRRINRSRFLMEFDWPGTVDPTPYLALPAAIRFLETLTPGGLPGLMRHNHSLALGGRDILCKALKISPPAPEEMIGAMASLPLPDGPQEPELAEPRKPYPTPIPALQEQLLSRYAIEVPIVIWPGSPSRLVRISGQIYNHPDQYRRLAQALEELLGEEKRLPA